MPTMMKAVMNSSYKSLMARSEYIKLAIMIFFNLLPFVVSSRFWNFVKKKKNLAHDGAYILYLPKKNVN